jgi:hypothetical protein
MILKFSIELWLGSFHKLLINSISKLLCMEDERRYNIAFTSINLFEITPFHLYFLKPQVGKLIRGYSLYAVYNKNFIISKLKFS